MTDPLPADVRNYLEALALSSQQPFSTWFSEVQSLLAKYPKPQSPNRAEQLRRIADAGHLDGRDTRILHEVADYLAAQ